MDIRDITAAIRDGKLRITDHAEEAAVDDHLTWDDIYYSAHRGEIIEDYPSAKPYPSCLVFGKSAKGEPIHSVWAYNPANQWCVIITVYRPAATLWINGRIRRKT
ncbi:MAG: DUF4258 domain-containing protein [Lentisphaerae bacterium]|nr:DUF4258 domain-containing protein [Lentisphaerota bacterium]